jgi:anti-anti-sigma factor
MKTMTVNNLLIYYPEGRITNSSAEQFERTLFFLINWHEDYDIIVNMNDVSSISSKGIAALVSAAEKMKSEERILCVISQRDLVSRVISILHVDSLIAVYKTEEEAVDELAKEAIKV